MLLVSCGTGMAEGQTLFERAPLVKKPHTPRVYRSLNGDLLVMKDGSVLFCYAERGEDGGIMAMRSTDLGKSWSQPSVLIPQPQPPAKGRYKHPSLLRLANGQILLSYIYITHPVTPYYSVNFYRRSADEGKTWTDQFLLTPYAGYTLIHNDKLFTLRDGRIIAMAAHKRYLPSSQDHSGYVGMSFYSDDNGYSWYPSKNAVDLYGTEKIEVQEPDGVELKDGRLLMFARTYSGFPVVAWSSDRGETWSAGKPLKQLKMPYAGLPTVRRIPSTGDLVFLWISQRCEAEVGGQKVGLRCALTSAVSKDEGETFIHQRDIAHDPGDDYGYQCIEFVGDDLALVAYHTADGIELARIGIDWFYGR